MSWHSDPLAEATSSRTPNLTQPVPRVQITLAWRVTQACGAHPPTHPAQDYSVTAMLLGSLCRKGAAALRGAIGRIYSQGRHLGEVSQHFVAVDADPTADNANKAMNWAIEAMAYSQWDTAIYVLKGLLMPTWMTPWCVADLEFHKKLLDRSRPPITSLLHC